MKIGISFTGGGARGISHLGVMQALQEVGIEASYFTGTSAGAIVGALLATEMSPRKILMEINSLNLLKYFRPAISWSGLIKMDKVEDLLHQFLPEDSFDSLKIPLAISATDYLNGKSVIFDKGPLIKPIMAASSIPFVFDPVEINGVKYVDGGIMNNLPVEPLMENCDFIIGSNCNYGGPIETFGSMRDVLERSLLLAINQNVQNRAKFCDVFIDPPEIRKFKIYHVNKADELFDVGYQFTKELIKTDIALKKILK
uniref:Patatin-like phospholipase n=1 Tax=uncultured microorganism TaxID=358574 RepID=A0A0B4ZTW2_9ZZZZ|nr:patatin-like phospholipase [uncultured microorganism]